MRRASILALCALLAASPAPAGGLRAATEAEAGAGVHAVGRIELGSSGYCSGALVSPTLVLTAAHCVHRPGTAEAYAPDDLRFRAGYRHGQAVRDRRIRRVVIHPDYRPDAPNSADKVAADLALLELAQGIEPHVIRPFAAAGRLGTGDRVRIVSYAQDRDEYPSYEDGCRVLARDARILALDCDVTFGASGAPVFAEGPDGLRIASVISSGARTDGTVTAFAATVEHGLARLMQEFGRPSRLSATAKTLRPGTGDRGTMRFIRP
ncbi:trypsin-like serine protease [Jannaschia sp. Os4]|uniref:trypsin-like serine peptidase n=1 Tax=Jannaschia sp. Os4 TaxID=2807617 RepID=UPI001939E79B|nr:trypsin-like serine protease [Jannaschia sp. Os4]MBM2577499.1 trypsin-like serine protease [Jannaschia sp. Os4]